MVRMPLPVCAIVLDLRSLVRKTSARYTSRRDTLFVSIITVCIFVLSYFYMDESQKREIHIVPPNLIVTAAAAALGMLAVFLIVSTLKELKEYRFVGSGVAASNTIQVSGMGEVFAVPDMGEFTVTVREEAATVEAAQEVATKKGNDIIAYLKSAGVEEKDIKTVSYNVNPKYEWEQRPCVNGICPPGNQNLVGFEVYQSLSVKVRDTQKAGELLSGVGSKGASEVSSLQFTIDDEDALKAEARAQAIAEAKAKADVLARDLGVSVVRVVGFYEESGGYQPYYARGAAMDMAVSNEVKMVAPEMPVGENKIISNVSITYEIR